MNFISKLFAVLAILNFFVFNFASAEEKNSDGENSRISVDSSDCLKQCGDGYSDERSDKTKKIGSLTINETVTSSSFSVERDTEGLVTIKDLDEKNKVDFRENGTDNKDADKCYVHTFSRKIEFFYNDDGSIETKEIGDDSGQKNLE